MELILVSVCAGMLVGSIWFFVRNEEREQVRASVVNKAALDATEKMEGKFDLGLAEIDKLSSRVKALEEKPSVNPAIPTRYTIEIVDGVKKPVDNSLGKASLELLRETSKAQQAVRSLKKVRSQGSRATQ